jgi:hypothetical protein
MSKKLTIYEFKNNANKKHNNFYIYDKVIYQNARTNITITCPLHGDFEQSPDNHLRGQGCPKCRYIKSGSAISKTHKDFIKQGKEIHNNFYDYSKTIYIKSSKKIIITCPIHGDFEQTPNKHLSGQGCIQCGITKNKIRQTNTIENFITLANKIHNNFYNYDKSNYVSNNTKITIVCPIHGDFGQTPANHINSKQGCPKCAGRYKTTNDFNKQASMIHNNFYNYDKTVYIGSNKKIIITCPIHGDFEQTPRSHLSGAGCPSCVSRISKAETLWLDSLNIKLRQHKIKINNKNFEVDGFDHETNTIYEFHGDFWHGNPSKFDHLDINPITKTTFGELYEKTLQRQQHLKNAGYNVISIWESDFN